MGQAWVLAGSLLALGLPVPGSAARAGELKVLAGGALTGVLGELGPLFERRSGHKVAIQFAATPDLIKLATSGAPFDLGVVPVDVMQDAAARAQFAPGSTLDVARVGFGVAVRTGTMKPDITTPAAFKQTLIEAGSIALLPQSAAGSYVLKIFDRLGLGDVMKAKTLVQTIPAGIPQAVAKGEAELGIFLMNVLLSPGVDLVGPFPGDLQQDLVFTAALSAVTSRTDAARAFIAFVSSPEAAAVIKAKGMTPG